MEVLVEELGAESVAFSVVGMSHSIEKLSREEFDRSFEKTDKPNIYKVKFEVEKQMIEFQKDFNDFFTTYLVRRKSSNMRETFVIGSMATDLMKKYNLSLPEILLLLKEKEAWFIKESVKEGIGFDDKHWNISEELKVKNNDNYSKDDVKINKKSNSGLTMSLGDQLKAKGFKI
jgi:hypothetical protein